MKESPSAYLPRDRLIAVASGSSLPAEAEGSVLFADISGFTPLTEAFEAHLGSRKGGEELTRILNEVYDRLIGEVDRMGGSVIGFAGDAITCWFSADDGLGAIQTALAMQRGMESFKKVPSPDGNFIALGLKAAVTTGRVKRFVVGNAAIQRVDVLAGDPVYQVANAEQVAKRGEVIIDKKTKLALGSKVFVTEERKGADGETAGFVIQSAEGMGQEKPWPRLEETGVSREVLDPWIISAIRERIGTGLGDFITELRPATAMFLKFEGIDFEHDPEASPKLDAFFSGVQEIVSDYDGVVHQLTVGDKGSFLYAAFGAPISHEDDTIRAMAVALKLRALADSLDFISAIRLGISRGTTRAGAYGGPTRRTYGVLGDQVNLAARLMGMAQPGQILVSETAALEAEKRYRLNTLPPIRVKGKTHPVAIREVVDRLQETDRTTGGYAIPMVGRRDELARIGELISDVSNGRGQVLSIIADAGLGKTRLVDEGIRLAQRSGFEVLHGECQTFGTNTLYTPWWTIWRAFFNIDGNESTEGIMDQLKRRLGNFNAQLIPRIPVLGPVLNLPFEDNELTRTFDAKLKRRSLESLLVECLRVRANQKPVLIVLEDVHAIDGVSRGLLQVLIQAIARVPVMILIAHRHAEEDVAYGEEEASLDYVHKVELLEFTEAEAAELIRKKCRQHYGPHTHIPRDVVDRIRERTEGNPFFIEEVMNWMHHQNINILETNSFDAAELPVSLHSLVLSRMDQLDENARVTMKVASVIGRAFRAAVLWGVYPDLGGESVVKNVLELLLQRDFTERHDEGAELAYLFKNVIIHEVAYESVPFNLRTRLHEAVGNFIETHFTSDTVQILDLLAFHFGRSSNLEKQKKYFLLAGDAARKAYASTAAIQYYESVLPLLNEIEVIPVLQNLGKALEVAGDWKRAMHTHKNALQMAEDSQRELEAANSCLDIGDLYRKMGSFEEADAWFVRARAGFEKLGDEPGMGQVLHSAGTLAAQTGKNDQAIDLYRRSIEIRRKLGDELRVANLMSNIGIVLRFQGKFDEALKHQEDSLVVRKKFNDPLYLGNSYNNLGVVKRFMGDLEGARADLEESVKMFQKVGDRAEVANALNSLAEVALDQKDTKSCEEYLQESLRLVRELGNMRALAYLFEAFASNAFNQERPRRCLRLFGVARALRTAIGFPLPKPDEEKLDDIVKQAAISLPGINIEDCLREGASLPLSTALDYAAGQEDSEL